MPQRKIELFASLFLNLALCFLATPSARADDEASVLKNLKTINTLSSTVPSNGDVNPYGVFEVPQTTGKLTKGHILVSNFNDAANAQGTGTTIVDIAPNGGLAQFAQINASTVQNDCPGGVGLTTALVVLRTGWVIVGSLPTSDGTSATMQAGCLIVLDSMGNVAGTIFGSLIDGPWDMIVQDGDQHAQLFVTNVLNGTVAASPKAVNTATILRINLTVSEKQMPSIESMTVIGSGFPARTDPLALVVGPTGVGLSPVCDPNDIDDCADRNEVGEEVLYVADSSSNRIAIIPDPITRTTSAGLGITLTSGGWLNDPLGLTVAPNGHILTVNGDDGFIVETTPQGKQIARKLLDSTVSTPPAPSTPGFGSLFGLMVDPDLGVVFVDDVTNTLNVLQ